MTDELVALATTTYDLNKALVELSAKSLDNDKMLLALIKGVIETLESVRITLDATLTRVSRLESREEAYGKSYTANPA